MDMSNTQKKANVKLSQVALLTLPVYEARATSLTIVFFSLVTKHTFRIVDRL